MTDALGAGDPRTRRTDGAHAQRSGRQHRRDPTFKPPPASWKSRFASSAGAQDVEAAVQTGRRCAGAPGRGLRAVCEPERFRGSGAMPAAPPVNPAESRAAAAQLIHSCRNGSRRRRFRSETHGGFATAVRRRAWPEFEQLVQGYAFDDAQERLERALESFAAA